MTLQLRDSHGRFTKGAIVLNEGDARLARFEEVAGETFDILQERIAELEFALEDQGWLRLEAEGQQEFSRDGLRRICGLSRLNYIKNPLINRAVSLQAAYVFGQGVNISSKDDMLNTLVQTFLDDPANKTELTSHQARMLKEVDLQVLGNIFFVFFTDTAGGVKVRTFNVDEITEIICNPEDAKEPWYYKRCWSENMVDMATGIPRSESKEEYYPDWRYEPALKQPAIGGKKVHWEAPVYHVKVGGMSGWRFGVPETYAALDWAKAYKEFLEDWSSIVRALSKFAWNMTVQGGRTGVQNAKTRLRSTIGQNGGTETNPPPLAGSTFISTPGTTMEPIRTSGATTSAEDGRRLLLMVAAATGFPESFFGDVSVGTLATAKSLDRPTELKMIDRQTLWTDVFANILEYVRRKKAGGNRTGMQVQGQSEATIDISFPPLLEHDVEASVNAIVKAATLDGKPLAGILPMEHVARLLLETLGEDNIDEVIAKMDFSVPSEATGAAPVPATASEAIMVQAAEELRQALIEARAKA